MSGENGSSWLKADYNSVFVEEWSPYFGAVLLVIIMAVLMGSGLFWGVFGGLKLWGDYFNNLIGLGPLLGVKAELDSPLMHRISLMDITLVLGAFCAAMLSQQFRISRPPNLEFVWGALGGALMGIGATFAGGCTTGGFFIPLTFSSPSGWVMWFGLLIGAIVGLKLLLWTMENITWGTSAPAVKPAKFKGAYPWIGALVLVGILIWAVSWWGSDNKMEVQRAILIIAGFGIGFVLHRSRFCFSRVFREPFMTGEGEMTKAMILALALGAPVGAVLLAKGTIDPYLAVPTRFWIGSLIGGLTFGIGMIFAGGCASGSLWRVGEGHLKLVVAVFFFGWAGSITSGVLGKLGLSTAEYDLDFMDGMAEVSPLGFQAFMPDLLGGWGWALLVTFALLLVWYLFVRYNESTNKFTVF
jgi:uncharacterized membrane protein YedE/YeeE